MNILHVLSQFEVTGAEAYAVTLMEEQLRSGHLATVVSDTLNLPTRATYIQIPIGRRSYRQRLKNIRALVHLIRQQSIDVVHAHSRAASWVSWFATRLTRTAFVSTVHGRQHIHTSSRSFSIYGRNVIAVSSALRDHLVRDLCIQPSCISVIPNCISFDWWDRSRAEAAGAASVPESSSDIILFVGRLTGPKGDVVRTLLQGVFPLLLQKQALRFHILGGMITPGDIPPLVASMNTACERPIVELRGFHIKVAAEMLQARAVIGSGRVVPESLYLKKPTIAYGESGYVGPVRMDTFSRAEETNFGDTGTSCPVDVRRIAGDILSLIEHPPTNEEREELARWARQRFDDRNVSRAIFGIYERARANALSRRPIPVLMYHRVIPDDRSAPAHGIWIRASAFARQLESLHRRGFETITFRDYNDFLGGERSLPPRPIVLTFDDGYVDNYALAYPLLEKYGFRAVIYAVTDRERRTNFWDSKDEVAPLLTATQMKELHQAGFEIGSHTDTHPRLTDLNPESARRELVTSKQHLEEILGAEVLSFAYPYGALNPCVKEMVAEAGYKFAGAADTGPVMLHEDFLEIRRTQVFPWTGTAGFWKKTLPLYQRYKRMKS